VKRALFLAALVGLVGCDGDPFLAPAGDGTPQDSLGPAAVEIIDAIRGRQSQSSWYITPDLENTGGPGAFYIHVEGVSIYPGGPRTQCGLTQTITVPAGWRKTLDFVFECAWPPQYLTVYTRAQGEDQFRVTDEWVY
jgi:hypothetical protein